MNIITILERRKSVRNFLENRINLEKLNYIVDVGNKSKALDPYIELKFQLVENGGELYNKLKGYGGYLGNMIKAPHYIVAFTEKKGKYLENLGFRMERLMIEAQEMGLGTCWIELFFYREKFNKILDNNNHNLDILAITPIGLEKKHFSQKLFKGIGNIESTRKRVDEILFFDYWENNRKPKNDLETNVHKIVNYARFAPSWANKQPWNFIMDKNKVIILSKKHKNSITNDKTNYFKIDCGIVMLYFQLVAKEIGVKGSWKFSNSDNLYEKYGVSHMYEYIGEYQLL